MGQFINQTVYTDFAKCAENVSIKKCLSALGYLNKIAVITVLQLLLTLRCIK